MQVGKHGLRMTTIRKVAERAGVSPTTVSHVLNHSDRVSKHLRERVLAAIDEMGYVANSSAKSLRTGRTNIVALLIPDILNSFYTEMVRAAQLELGRSGRDIMVFNADVPGGAPREHSRKYLAQLRSKGVDGLIVGDFALHGMYEAIHQIEMPSVFIGHLPNGGVDNVRASDYGGAFEMGQYLVRRGYGSIAHVTGPADFPAAVIRRDGFHDGAIGAGLDPSALDVFEGTYLSPSGEEAIHSLFGTPGRRSRSKAVFFSNNLMCQGGLAALSDLGLDVPGDVAVAVFGQIASMRYVRPILTRVGVDPGDLARRAVQMLTDRLDRIVEDGTSRCEIIECRLDPGASA